MLKDIIMSHKNANDEEHIINLYILFGWSLVLAVLLIAYLIEVIKNQFSLGYYLVFVGITVIPFSICVYLSGKKKLKTSLRMWISLSYFIMYLFVLFTGHTMLVFTYILPLSTLLVLYHDLLLIVILGVSTILANIAFIFVEYSKGHINLANSKNYEIEMALIVLCFIATIISSFVYDKVTKLKEENDNKIHKLILENAILEDERKWANIDYLTKLYSRKRFEEDLIKDSGRPYFLALIDVNGLKKCNDTFGHKAGDDLLMAMGECMIDTFKESSNIYRMGGDEFCIVSYLEEAKFRKCIENLRVSMSKWEGVYGNKLSASIGIVHSSEHESARELLKLSDMRMYDEKFEYYKRMEGR